MSSEKRTIHGRWIRWLCYAKEFTQADIASRVGVDPAQVSKWKTGESNPREAYWTRLAELAGVSRYEYWQGPRGPGPEMGPSGDKSEVPG